MKKLIAISLLLLSILLSTGNYLIYRSVTTSYKKDFREFIGKNIDRLPHTVLGISESDLYVNTEELVWEDENKEIFYKGKLYDIAGIRKSGSAVVLTIFEDAEESDIRKKFAQQYDDQGQTGLLVKILKQFMSLKYIPSGFVFEPSGADIQQRFISLSDPAISSGYAREMLIPPLI